MPEETREYPVWIGNYGRNEDDMPIVNYSRNVLFDYEEPKLNSIVKFDEKSYRINKKAYEDGYITFWAIEIIMDVENYNILQILPSDGWCVRRSDVGEDGEREYWDSRVAVWALVQDDYGHIEVIGMDTSGDQYWLSLVEAGEYVYEGKLPYQDVIPEL